MTITIQQTPSGRWKFQSGNRRITIECYTGNPFQALAALVRYANWPAVCLTQRRASGFLMAII